MAGFLVWVEALAGLKALYDVIKFGADYAVSLARHKQEPDTITEARRVSATYSTYSDDEIKAVIDRINGCRDRFIKQGGGADRARCLCSIFEEIKTGNGGTLPEIDDWRNMYDQLNCGF